MHNNTSSEICFKIPSLDKCRNLISGIAKLPKISIEACMNGCIAFTGEYERDTICRQCKTPRRTETRNSTKFEFVDFAVQLKNRWSNKSYARLFRTQLDNPNVSDCYQSVYDGKIINHLKQKQINIDGQILSNYYFEDTREGALTLCTDLVGIFKRQKRQAWPLIIIDHALPPSIRNKNEFITFAAVIPGKFKNHAYINYNSVILYRTNKKL